jgi:hypothetical protein
MSKTATPILDMCCFEGWSDKLLFCCLNKE